MRPGAGGPAGAKPQFNYIYYEAYFAEIKSRMARPGFFGAHRAGRKSAIFPKEKRRFLTMGRLPREAIGSRGLLWRAYDTGKISQEIKKHRHRGGQDFPAGDQANNAETRQTAPAEG
jgi:hypothetical protein